MLQIQKVIFAMKISSHPLSQKIFFIEGVGIPK